MDALAVASFLRRHDLRLVTAESCTGGLIAANIADVKGAGELLDCAFVTYSPGAKRRCLGVKAGTLARFNLTSEVVAREMAVGALSCTDVNLAVSNTGVADSVDDAVARGTQCYAWVFVGPRGGRTIFSETKIFDGSRNAIRQKSAMYALSRIPSLYAKWRKTD